MDHSGYTSHRERSSTEADENNFITWDVVCCDKTVGLTDILCQIESDLILTKEMG